MKIRTVVDEPSRIDERVGLSAFASNGYRIFLWRVNGVKKLMLNGEEAMENEKIHDGHCDWVDCGFGVGAGEKPCCGRGWGGGDEADDAGGDLAGGDC